MAVFFSRFPRTARGGATLEATEARQGRWGRHVFWVLVISTALAVIALFSAWGFHSGDLTTANENSRPTPAEAKSVTGPGGPIKQESDDASDRTAAAPS